MSKPLRKTKTLEESEIDPWKLFLNAMRSPVTRDRYSTKVAKFFDFIEIPGRTLEQKAVNFARKGRNDAAWAFSAILKFIYYQRERVEKKEISGATVINYTKSIKLFCDMADIIIAWNKITHGLPRGKKYADVRIPTLEELKQLVDYPDRRIKAIVYTMASSGIRVGAWDYLRWSHIRPIEKNGGVPLGYPSKGTSITSRVCPNCVISLNNSISNSFRRRDLTSYRKYSFH